MITAKPLTSRMRGNSHVRFSSSGVCGDIPADYNLASQCRQALYAEGFDLACGFLHADRSGRDSLTYDLVELERGAVDDLVLTFLGKTTLHYADFARTADGALTLHPQLTRLLLASCRVPQALVDEHAKWLRRFLLSGLRREDDPAE